MDGHDVIIVIFGIKWTLPLIITATVSTLGGLLTLYKLVERWQTRNARRLDMLREYLDKEEKDISSRRKNVLDNIRMSEHSFLSDKKFDVGAEIDRALICWIGAIRSSRAESWPSWRRGWRQTKGCSGSAPTIFRSTKQACTFFWELWRPQ
jgi:hypothetical protein